TTKGRCVSDRRTRATPPAAKSRFTLRISVGLANVALRTLRYEPPSASNSRTRARRAMTSARYACKRILRSSRESRILHSMAWSPRPVGLSNNHLRTKPASFSRSIPVRSASLRMWTYLERKAIALSDLSVRPVQYGRPVIVFGFPVDLRINVNHAPKFQETLVNSFTYRGHALAPEEWPRPSKLDQPFH